MRKFRVKAVVPVGIHILVEPLEHAAPADQTILAVTVSDEAPSIGQILSAGHGARHPEHGFFILPGYSHHEDTEATFKAGDVICYRKYTGAELVIDGRAFLVLTPDDILGIIGGEFVEEESQ